MAGEMFRSELTPDEYPLHFAIARALGGTVEPFDVYQGPYVAIGPDESTRLWVMDSTDGVWGRIWNETTRKQSSRFPLHAADAREQAVICAAKVITPKAT